MKLLTAFLSCSLLGFTTNVNAQDGYPIAVTRMADGVDVQSFWGLKLSIKFAASSSSPQPDHVALSADVDHLYFRLPNTPDAQWKKYSDLQSNAAGDGNAVDAEPEKIANAIRARAWQPDDKRLSDAEDSDAKVEEPSPILVSVDGCTLLFIDGDKIPSVANLTSDVDLVCVFVRPGLEVKPLDEWAASKMVRRLLLVPVTAAEEATVQELQQKLTSESVQIREVSHNCLAISSNPTVAGKQKSDASSEGLSRQVITLSLDSWEMPEDMNKAFAAMEAACSASQSVFAKLTTEQMNFKPGNGTHTPRWNAEHMMGRQLLFFSQIYNRIDPAIPVLNLNPKQNPEDYVAAHSDWTGAEEARQMQRVSEFTRKFAFLLDGVKLEQRAPGSRWPTLNALLRQMDRHYSEHTAKTEKKFELDDWPQE